MHLYSHTWTEGDLKLLDNTLTRQKKLNQISREVNRNPLERWNVLGTQVMFPSNMNREGEVMFAVLSFEALDTQALMRPCPHLDMD